MLLRGIDASGIGCSWFFRRFSCVWREEQIQCLAMRPQKWRVFSPCRVDQAGDANFLGIAAGVQEGRVRVLVLIHFLSVYGQESQSVDVPGAGWLSLKTPLPDNVNTIRKITAKFAGWAA